MTDRELRMRLGIDTTATVVFSGPDTQGAVRCLLRLLAMQYDISDAYRAVSAEEAAGVGEERPAVPQEGEHRG